MLDFSKFAKMGKVGEVGPFNSYVLIHHAISLLVFACDDNDRCLLVGGIIFISQSLRLSTHLIAHMNH